MQWIRRGLTKLFEAARRRPVVAALCRRIASRSLAGALATAGLCVIGAVLLHSSERLGKATLMSSYNALFSTYGVISSMSGRTSNAASNDVVILYLDEESYRHFGYSENEVWNRATHAALLDRLTADSARAVVFDIVFGGAGPDANADEALAAAIKRNGRVILAAEPPTQEYQVSRDTRIRVTVPNPPWERFATRAAGWGIAALNRDEDWIVREHWHAATAHDHPSLAWAAASVMQLDSVKQPNAGLQEKWINYYDRPNAVPGRSYRDAFDAPPGYFSNKVVFVGARSMVLKFGERRDEYRTPYTTWFKQPVFYPAVDVHAHMLLNLMRGDWLRRIPPVVEWLAGLLVAAGAGFGLVRMRARTAFFAATIASVVVFAAVVLLFAVGRYWFAWIACIVQIFAGLGFSFCFNSFAWWWEERRLKEQRRRDERRIREQAELLDKAQDAIFVYDLASRITYWNQSAELLYGWNSSEALNAEVEEILGSSEDGGLAEVRQVVLEKGEWHGELRQTTRAGRQVIVDSRCTRVCDDTGKPKAILVINTDITERKRLESQLLRAQRMESIGTLAGGIAHDLNNVLSPIVMATQLLQRKADTEQEKKFLSTIEVSARRAADMVKQVLAFARGQEGETVVLQLKHVIRDMEKIMRETFPRSINLELYIASNLPTIKGDATQLHQVILNLCVNARDAMPNGGTLKIRAEPRQLSERDAAGMLNAKAGPYVCLTVTDSGTGMPPEVIERIYEPFFTTKEPGKGTGLGLSTVLSIIKAHAGVIDVASSIGAGTTFTVLFPALEESAAQPATAEAEPMQRGSGTVLVVDDEPLIGVMVESILATQGYKVLLAENGAAGVDMFQRHRPEIVLLDMMMPVMDGAQAMAEIRRIQPDTKIIFMSGLVQENQIPGEHGDNPPVVMSKPFTGEKLLTTIQSVEDGDARRAA